MSMSYDAYGKKIVVLHLPRKLGVWTQHHLLLNQPAGVFMGAVASCATHRQLWVTGWIRAHQGTSYDSCVIRQAG
jgi:hypothetical protein